MCIIYLFLFLFAASYYLKIFFLYFVEILPIIEFYLEDDISDAEAIKIIRSSYSENKLKESHIESHNVDTLVLEEEFQDQSIDPFTYKFVHNKVCYEFIIKIV